MAAIKTVPRYQSMRINDSLWAVKSIDEPSIICYGTTQGRADQIARLLNSDEEKYND